MKYRYKTLDRKEKYKMKIAVAGTGYVGLSNAILLSQNNQVYAVDIIQEKVEMINRKESPIVDKEIEEYLKHRNLNLIATTDAALAYANADFIIISTPTNYDPKKNYFDTSSVESVIEQVLEVNPNAIMIIKSTQNRSKKNTIPIIFCFHRNFYVKDALYTIICIRPELL